MGRIWEAVLRAGRAGKEQNYYFAHSVWNGTAWVTVISHSRTDPFLKAGKEPATVMGTVNRSPATREQIERIHRLAALVRLSYGEDAIGALPALPAEPQTEKAA